MADKADERVMCIKTRDFEKVGVFTGFTEDWQKYTGSLLVRDCIRWLRRRDCETDPSFKQIIPYMVLTYAGRGGTDIAIYQRTPMSGEKRLHGKWSLGVGGHISEHDANLTDLPTGVFREGWRRELREELRMDTQFDATIEGMIYDPSTAVGSVHLGILLNVRLQLPAIYPANEEISRLHFVTAETAIAGKNGPLEFDDFEEWSKIVLGSDYAERGFKPHD